MDVAKTIGDLIELYVYSTTNILNDGGFETGDWELDWTTNVLCTLNNTIHHNGTYSLYIEKTNASGYLKREWNPETTVYPRIESIELYGCSYAVGSDQLEILIHYEDDTEYNENYTVEYADTGWTSVILTNPDNTKKIKYVKIIALQSIFIDDVKINIIHPVTVKYDEFDIIDPILQVLIENFPAKTTWIIEGVYRVEHRVRLTLYKKLIHYAQEHILDYKDTWFNVKELIDKVIIKNKFALSGCRNLIIGTWTDNIPSIAVGRGIKTKKEPIVWKSENIVSAIYYYNETLVSE
jgi:hypothetical protein